MGIRRLVVKIDFPTVIVNTFDENIQNTFDSIVDLIVRNDLEIKFEITIIEV